MKTGMLARWTTMTAAMALVAACSKDPSANVPQAQVKAANEQTAAAPTGKVETLAVSTAGSKVGFVGSKVTASHEGAFGKFSGMITLVDGAADKSTVAFEVDMSSVSTEDPKLTGHLQSPDFFNVGQFPKATFQSTKIAGAGTAFQVTGNLELHGVKKEVTFPATITVEAKEVAVKSEFSINRKDFGIVYPGMPDNLIRDNVVIKIDLHVPRSG